MDRYRNTRLVSRALLIGSLAYLGIGTARSQIPDAPPTPVCGWDSSSGNKVSTCRFKEQMSGTPTSVVGNRVIVYSKGTSGGQANTRTFNADALKRLATRYGFTAMVTEDPTIFTAANLANTKVVIMNNGEGDVVPIGANRTALQDFQQVNGWGVIWIHAACAFITSGWPFGQQSCVQQYHQHNPSGTPRRIFIDSGTAENPNQGIKSPQTEFLMRALPGWAGNRAMQLSDKFFCFQAPARNTPGVNVLLGYDRSSGLPDPGCPNSLDTSDLGSQDHNLAWTHAMGNGITIYNSLGHDVGVYTGNGNAGDSLLWRFIRYAAKDWEVAIPASFKAVAKPVLDNSLASGPLSLSFTDAGRHVVTVFGLTGKPVFARTYSGVTRAEIPNLKRDLYFVRVVSNTGSEVKKIRLF